MQYLFTKSFLVPNKEELREREIKQKDLFNETIYEICQKEGVRMDCVLQYNGLRKNMQPLAGERIYLRSVAPVVPKTVFASLY